jgi:hypothetical protein
MTLSSSGTSPSSTWTVRGLPSCTTASVTWWLPPAIAIMLRSLPGSFTGRPSMAVTTVPAVRPALCAGPSSSTLAISTPERGATLSLLAMSVPSGAMWTPR